MKGFDRGQPLSTFGKPPDTTDPVTADDFMAALDAYIDDTNEQTRAELRECVASIFMRLGG